MQGDIYGRKLALLTRRDGADAVQLHTGILAFTQCELLLDRGPQKRPFRLRTEWLSRLEAVDGDQKDRLDDADLLLSLTDAELSEQERAVLN
ncbi:MAG TPA: hypothetical protein VLV76_06055 [Candidatus Acidoferrum sp.]|nr:hypothetical protein [Candidatus Acidoferrum sp.]